MGPVLGPRLQEQSLAAIEALLANCEPAEPDPGTALDASVLEPIKDGFVERLTSLHPEVRVVHRINIDE